AERTLLTGSARPQIPGPLYRFPRAALLDCPMACVPLGIARSAITTLVALAPEKSPTGSQILLRDLPAVQADVARAEALVRSARAFLYESAQEVWELVQAGGTATIEQQALMRLARAQAATAAAQAVDLMY